MQARAFLIASAVGFAAASLAFIVHALVEGRGIDGSFLLAAAFAGAFILLAVRVPRGERAASPCAACGRALMEGLTFCGRCGATQRGM